MCSFCLENTERRALSQPKTHAGSTWSPSAHLDCIAQELSHLNARAPLPTIEFGDRAHHAPSATPERESRRCRGGAITSIRRARGKARGACFVVWAERRALRRRQRLSCGAGESAVRTTLRAGEGAPARRGRGACGAGEGRLRRRGAAPAAQLRRRPAAAAVSRGRSAESPAAVALGGPTPLGGSTLPTAVLCRYSSNDG